jgi:carboxyl-terminal processing protease
MSTNSPSVDLSENDRRKIFDSTFALIEREFFLPGLPTPDVQQLRQTYEAQVVGATERDAFESSMQSAVQAVAPHHIGFFHSTRPRMPASAAFGVRAVPAQTPGDGNRWRFSSVDPTGPAGRAGVSVGDLLIAVDGEDVYAPGPLQISHGRSYSLRMRKLDGLLIETVVEVPILSSPARRSPPTINPETPVTWKKLRDNIGLVRITAFPGRVGVEVARDISAAIAQLASEKLIIDLRGNAGGGVGALRVMSHLCADVRGVGYSVSRALLATNYRKEDLPRFHHIPRSKLGLPILVARYAAWRLAGKAKTVALFTEGLGSQRHHGQTVILIDRASASASEMVAAFAAENQGATLVGTTTPGRLAASTVKPVGGGYSLMLPVGGYMTWKGRLVEPGKGIAPDVEVELDPDTLGGEEDNQLAKAREVLH